MAIPIFAKFDESIYSGKIDQEIVEKLDQLMLMEIEKIDWEKNSDLGEE